MLTSKQRALLRKEANTLQPVFQIGKDGVNEPLVRATANCLKARELVKVKALETCPTMPKDTAFELAQQTKAEVVQVIGRSIVLFKRDPQKSAYAQLLNPKKEKHSKK